MLRSLVTLPAFLLATSAQAHEDAAAHGALAEESLGGALMHRVLGGHHLGETFALVGVAVLGAILVARLRGRS